MWDEVKGVIGTFAPTIATALGGPLAGGAVKVLTGALGLNDGAKPKEVLGALADADPAVLQALKKADQDFEIRMKELDVDLEKLAADDRDSARARQVALGDQTPAILGYVIVAGFFGILAAMIFVDLPSGSGDILKVLLGSLGAMTVQVGNFFFGSSRGSRIKDAMIPKS